MNEKLEFHPFVARWLKFNNYTYDHEVKMPEYGRADFVAHHNDGHMLVVECKVNESANDGRSIIQLVDYQRQIPNSKAAYAVPASRVSDKIVILCKTYNVQLIIIDLTSKDYELPLPELKSNLMKPRRKYLHDETKKQIKAIARRLMAEQGTAGLGLRAIGREMDVTAPAIYRYFPSLDDLITELIIENFNALADAMAAGAGNSTADDYAGRLLGMLLAYRQWALDHPIDFQLIYGNPIPGYVAPAERTVPAARRGFDVVVGILSDAIAAGKLAPPPEYEHLPESIAAQLAGVIAHEGYDVPLVVLYLATVGWTRIHGIVMLELFDDIQPVVGDTEAFYRFEMNMLMKQLGYDTS